MRLCLFVAGVLPRARQVLKYYLIGSCTLNFLCSFLESTLCCTADLNLWGNSLTGMIPSTIGLLTNLGESVCTSLNIWRVCFVIILISVVARCSADDLNFHSNRLTGSIPSTIGLLTKLRECLTAAYFNMNLLGCDLVLIPLPCLQSSHYSIITLFILTLQHSPSYRGFGAQFKFVEGHHPDYNRSPD